MYKHPKPKKDWQIAEEVHKELSTVMIPEASDLKAFPITTKKGVIEKPKSLWDGQAILLRICQEKWETSKEPAWLDIHRSVQSGVSTFAMMLVAWMLTQKDKICVVTCIDNKTAKHYKDVVSNMLDGKAMQCKKDQILNIGNSFATFSSYEKIPKFIEGKPIHGLVCFDSDWLNKPEEHRLANDIKYALHRRPPCFAFHVNKRELDGSPWSSKGSFFNIEI